MTEKRLKRLSVSKAQFTMNKKYYRLVKILKMSRLEAFDVHYENVSNMICIYLVFRLNTENFQFFRFLNSDR